MGTLTLFQAVFLFTSQLLITICVILSQMTAKTVHLYSQYYKYDSAQWETMCEDEKNVHYFGMWTSREYYSNNVGSGMKNSLNPFDYRIRSSRAFMTLAIIISMLLLVFTTDRLCRRFAGPNRSSEGDDWCKWVHIFLCGGQFYCIFISTWCFSSLIHTCSSPWNFIIMCISVGISGIVGCFIVTCEINIPEQEPETGKITGKTRTFFIVAIAFCAATVILSLGSLAKVSDPNSESKDKTYTSLMILLNSFTQGHYKTATLVCFITSSAVAAVVILVLVILILLRKTASLQLVLILTMEIVYLYYAVSLVSLCLITRAPALLDDKVYGSVRAISMYLEIVKFVFVNVVTWLVVLGVVNRDDILGKFKPPKSPHHDSFASDDDSLFSRFKKGKDSKQKEWKKAGKYPKDPSLDENSSQNVSMPGLGREKKREGGQKEGSRRLVSIK